MFAEFKEIPFYEQWIKIEKVNYGWSSDEKYYIEDLNGRKLLLRVNSIHNYESKKKEFEIIQKYNKLDFPMSEVVSFGMCNQNQNVYMLLTWVEGESLENIIQSLDEKEQYQLGIQAGKILKSIHTLPVEKQDYPKETKRAKKLLQLEKYENSKYRIPEDEEIIRFVRDRIQDICRLEPAYEHGDFHIGNLIYMKDNTIGVIDFNRWECGDPYEEFYKMQSFDIEKSIPFAAGQIHGYFQGEPDKEFWQAQAVYVAHASLFSIVWASQFDQSDIDGMTERCMAALQDYNNFKKIIPDWYEKYELGNDNK